MLRNPSVKPLAVPCFFEVAVLLVAGGVLLLLALLPPLIFSSTVAGKSSGRSWLAPRFRMPEARFTAVPVARPSPARAPTPPPPPPPEPSFLRGIFTVKLRAGMLTLPAGPVVALGMCLACSAFLCGGDGGEGGGSCGGEGD